MDWELVNYCEIDRWASLSYSMVNQCGESLNLRDVRTVTAETVRDRQVDLITYGFPCQDISIAGKQQGFVNDSGESTRSGLFFEALRIIKELRPRYAIAENVKALTSTKFKNEFATVLSSLEEAGYNNYWRVLNAKDYGIPQNRERVFIVSIRRDVDEGDFQFPDKEPLMLRLRDMLEPTESVDEKYYLSTEREGVRRLLAELGTRYSLNSSTAVCVASRGRNPDNPSDCTTGSPTEQRLEPNSDGCTNTLTTVQKDNLLLIAEPKIIQVGNIVDNHKDPLKIAEPRNTRTVRIRKLTPRECWRLMGFLDEEFDRVNGISNSQLYKQAGNSIVVNVLSALLSQLFYRELV